MKTTVIKSFIALSFISSSLLAQVEVDPKLLVNENKKLLKENKLNQIEGKKDSLEAVSKDNLNTITNITKKSSNKKIEGLDTSVYKKVKLIDAVLETLSQSEILKSSRENVIQYELKLKNTMAEYYPTIDFEYVRGRTRSKPGDDEDTKFKFYNDEYYKFVLRQNLYSGGSTNYMVKSVAKKLEVAKNQYKIKLDAEIKKAIKAYFDVVFANRSVMVNERNMKKLNKILEIVTIKYDNGAASIGDLTSIKANVANAMTKLVKVKSKFIESLRYYEYIVGTSFEKTLPFEKNFDIKIDEFDKLYERALENNKNLINYYQSIQAEKFKHKSIRGKFEPKVDFELSYQETLQSEDIVDDVYEQDINGKIRVSYNLFNGGRDKNRVLEVNSTIRDLNYRLEEEKKKLKWNLSKTHTSITTVSDALKSTIEEVVASRKMVSSYWEAFKLGEQDLQALLQGQKQLNAAETEVVNFEKNQVNDFFSILELTGDLSAFFDVDPENPKFIDFSKSDYKKTIVAKDGEKISLNLEEDKEKQEEVEKQEVKEIVIPELSLEEKINNYIKEFNSFDDESFMIKIETFNNIYDAFIFIKDKKIDKNSFSFDTLEQLKIKNIVVHNNFENKKLAEEYIQKFKVDSSEKELSAIKVKEVKKLYKSYLAGLEIEKPKAKVKIVEKIRQEKQKEEFLPNEEFKEKFFNSSEEFYTINVSSFASKKELEDFVISNALYENVFFFKYFSSVELYKLVMGIYPNYENIENDINKLALKNNGIFPIVEKIGSIKEQFKENIDLNIQKRKPKEYEYISLNELEKQKKKEEEQRKKEEELAKEILIKEEKAKLEAQKKAEEARVEKEKLEIQRLENERVEREKLEQELLENEKKIAQEIKLAEEKAKQETLKQVDEVEEKVNNIENNSAIEEIDLSEEKKEKREFIPYIKRVEIFEKEFAKADKNKYTLYLTTIKPEEISWYRKRFALEPYHISITKENKTKIYFGIFDTKEEALDKINYLHPKIFEANPSPKKIGNIR